MRIFISTAIVESLTVRASKVSGRLLITPIGSHFIQITQHFLITHILHTIITILHNSEFRNIAEKLVSEKIIFASEYNFRIFFSLGIQYHRTNILIQGSLKINQEFPSLLQQGQDLLSNHPIFASIDGLQNLAFLVSNPLL